MTEDHSSILPPLNQTGLLNLFTDQRIIREKKNEPQRYYEIPSIGYSNQYQPISPIKQLINDFTSNEYTYQSISSFQESFSKPVGIKPQQAPRLFVLQGISHPPPNIIQTNTFQHHSSNKIFENVLTIQTSTIPSTSDMIQSVPRSSSRYCKVAECTKLKQTKGLCKLHGGGSRCSFRGCGKSNQGGGFCRAHGGGKRCLVEGCEKGAQRGGKCHGHGGINFCRVELCNRKDRGTGLRSMHGGRNKCDHLGCEKIARKNGKCNSHLSS